MIGPAGYLLAILGCGEAEAPCQQVAIAPARYSSQAECLAAVDAALARSDDGDFPVMVGECRATTARFAALRADEVRRPEPRGRIPIRTAAR